MQQQIQSVTNVYTLQGWIKGIVPGDPNALIAKQAFNYGLGYFTNDYTPIGSISDPFVSLNKGNDLYNGNIKAMLVNIPKVGEPVLHSYKYDQLNRIKEVNNYNNYSSSNNTWSATNAHKESLSFDANGNIQTALLNGSAGNLPYENFTYNYDAVKKNRLLSIHNGVDNTTSNYEYDEIGNITKDELEGNKDMVWSIYGKLLMAKKISTGVKITYSYDASGNRISKQVGNSYEEWTVRDAAGNVMATYVKDPAINNGRLTTQGYEMYGSSAIGTWEKRRDVETEGANNNERVLIRGEQKIRFSNHLGNTMLVLSDIKRQIQSPEDPSQITGYTPEVINATDYSAYGESLIGREFSSEGIKFGFNGKLNDNDLGYQDYGMRLSSVKKRGFLSVDPLTASYPWYTPYQFAGNTVISAIDLDGLEEKIVTSLTWTDEKGKNHTTVTTKENVNNIYNLGTGTLFITIIDKTKYDNGERSGQATYIVHYESSLRDIFQNIFKDNKFGFVYVSKGGQGSEIKLGSRNVKFAETLDISILVGVMANMKAYGDFGSIVDFMKSKNFKIWYETTEKFIEAGGRLVEALKELTNDIRKEPEIITDISRKLQNENNSKAPVFDTVNSKESKDVEKKLNHLKFTRSSTEIKKGKDLKEPDTIRTTIYQAPK